MLLEGEPEYVVYQVLLIEDMNDGFHFNIDVGKCSKFVRRYRYERRWVELTVSGADTRGKWQRLMLSAASGGTEWWQ